MSDALLADPSTGSRRSDLVEADPAASLGRFLDRLNHLRDRVAEGEVRLGRPSATAQIKSRALMIF
jgi:hypothetical protein